MNQERRAAATLLIGFAAACVFGLYAGFPLWLIPVFAVIVIAHARTND